MQPADYYAIPRLEMLTYLPKRPLRILECGCGAGVTMAAIRALHRVEWAGGIEFVPEQARRIAPGTYDRLWVGDIEREPLETDITLASLDAILCFDVLEHLADPWMVVKRLSPLLRPGGRLIISLPNVRNWRFLRNLMLRGDFHYTDAGLLDRTHLRFFVRDTAVELATCGGLRLVSVGSTKPWSLLTMKGLLSLLTAHVFDDLIVKQFAIVAQV